MVEEQDLTRRFAGVGRLYGESVASRFAQAKVCVVGVGGVGSWAAEALARTGVGQITLIDLDNVAESNTNRQIHALDPVWGMPKVEAMRARILAINPACTVQVVEDFLTADNIDTLLAGQNAVIDAIDQPRIKVEMILWSVKTGVPVIVTGAAGGKQDPTLIREDDITKTEQDALLAKVRSQLRRQHGFPKDIRRKFGIRAIYSAEAIQRPVVCETGETVEAPQGLSCAGYGSGVCVTAPFGFFAAAAALRMLSQG